MVSRDRVPRCNREYRAVNAPWTYFCSPAAPDRSVVSSNPATFAAMSSVLISLTVPAAMDVAFARQEWMNPADTSAPARLHRQVLEDQQVDGQRTQPRPDRYRGVRDAGRAGRHVGLPALAPGLVQVMLHGDGFRLGDLFLLAGPGDAKIGGAVEVRPALAGALGEPVAGHIRLGPGHRRPRRPRLLAPLALLRRVPLRRAPLLPGRPAAGRVIAAGRHRGVTAVTGNGALQAGYSVLQVRDLGIPRRELLPELRDLLVAGSARGATQGRRQHLGHGR